MDTVTLREVAVSHVKELKAPETVREFITTCQLLRREAWVVGERPTVAEAARLIGFVREGKTLLTLRLTNDGYAVFSTEESEAYGRIDGEMADRSCDDFETRE